MKTLPILMREIESWNLTEPHYSCVGCIHEFLSKERYNTNKHTCGKACLNPKIFERTNNGHKFLREHYVPA